MPVLDWDRDFDDGVSVRGALHRPEGDFDTALRDTALVLAHGAGGTKESPLLVATADEFSKHGIATLRIDLPYRQKRPKGPPSPSGAAKDRLGIVRAVESLQVSRVFIGGTSYGGRQASLLAAEQPDLAAGLILLSYPLHPPGKPESLRTQHFPQLTTPSLFLHGSRDGFGSIAEMEKHLPLIAGRRHLTEFPKAGHGLVSRKTSLEEIEACAAKIYSEFSTFLA